MKARRSKSGERSIRALRQRFSTPGVQQYEHLPGMKRKFAQDCHTCDHASPREHVMAGLVRQSCLRNRWRRMLLVLLGVAVVLTAFTILLCGGHTNVKEGATNVGGVMPGEGGSHDIDTSRAMSPVSTIRSRGIAASSTATTTTATETVTATINQTDTHRQATTLCDYAIAKVPDVKEKTNAALHLPETAEFVAMGVYVLAVVWGVQGLVKHPRGGRRPAFSRGLSFAATSIVVFACLGGQPYSCSATMLADPQSVADQTHTVPMPFHHQSQIDAVNVLHVSRR